MASALVEQGRPAAACEVDFGCGNTGRQVSTTCLQEEQPGTDDNVVEEHDGDPLEDFRPLLLHLRLDSLRLSELAISLKTALVGDEDAKVMTCNVNPQPLMGSYNILYGVNFSDSSAWIFKLPSTGYLPEWSEASGRKL